MHDVHDVGGAADGTEVDDGVVAEAKLVDVPGDQIEVILVAVRVLLANLLRAPFLQEISCLQFENNCNPPPIYYQDKSTLLGR